MKYNIVHTCGHTETVQIYGTNVHGERDRKARWLESRPCRECETAAKEQGRDMAALQGSEKQIAWARDIRVRMIDELTDFVEFAIENADDTPENAAKVRANLDKAVRNICAQTDAGWIIDHRDDGMQELFVTAYNNKD